MIQINLLPWREQARQIQKARLTVFFIITLGLVLLVLTSIHIYYKSQVNHQLRLNTYLQTQINEQQAAIDNISAKQKDKLAVQEKLNFISNIFAANYDVIRLFNELTVIVPANIKMKSIFRHENKITFIGSAPSDSEITQFMQDIAHSPLFNQPVLSAINSETDNNSATHRIFKIDVEQKRVV